MNRYFTKDDISFMWLVVGFAIGTFSFLAIIGAI